MTGQVAEVPTAKEGSSFWEHFPHSADIGIRGCGPTVDRAFEQAAIALTAVVTDPAQVQSRDAVVVSCEGADAEMLLVEWLNAVVYEMATRHMLFGRYSVHTDGNHLHATLWGEPVDVNKHQPSAEVKGATLTALKVCRDSTGTWLAQCVVDV